MSNKLLPIPVLEKALGAPKNAKRLKLNSQENGTFLRPVNSCYSEPIIFNEVVVKMFIIDLVGTIILIQCRTYQK